MSPGWFLAAVLSTAQAKVEPEGPLQAGAPIPLTVKVNGHAAPARAVSGRWWPDGAGSLLVRLGTTDSKGRLEAELDHGGLLAVDGPEGETLLWIREAPSPWGPLSLLLAAGLPFGLALAAARGLKGAPRRRA